MNKTFVDTFYVVALVNKRDEFHEKANDLVLEFDSQPLLTTDAVLLEVGNSLARSNKQKSIEIISQFVSAAEIEIIRLEKRFLIRLSLFTKSTPINRGAWLTVFHLS